MIDVKKLKMKLDEYDLNRLPPSRMKFDLYLHYIYDGWDEHSNGHYAVIIDSEGMSLILKENRFDYPTKYSNIKINTPEEFKDILMNKIVPYIMGIPEDEEGCYPLLDINKLSIESVAFYRTDSKTIYPIDEFMDIFKQCFVKPVKPNKYRTTHGFERKDM